MGNKNQRRKQRRHEQNKNNVTLSERFDFVRKLAEKWGKKLQMDRTCDLNASTVWHHIETENIDIITIDDLTGPTKRNKACQAEPSTNGIGEWNQDEYDEDGLHFTYISPLSSSSRSSLSVICLDDDDDCEEVIMRTFKSEDTQPSLNISSTSSNSQGSTTPLPKAPSAASINDRVLPPFSESSVIGVHFNPAATPIPGKIQEYRSV
uniref:BESS domain-containing protein n=1 Tax=Haemonchus placei TaxID=6290 RepID=A0A0N4WAS2_HAEPC